MNISKFVLKNILRRKSRFVLTLSGIIIGVSSLIILLLITAGLESDIKAKAGDLGGNLIVTPKGWCAYEQINVLLGEQLPEQVSMSDIDKISKVEGITAVAPFLTEGTAINNSPVTVVGIIPEVMQNIKNWKIKKGQYLSNEEFSAIIGSGLVKQFNLDVGQEIKIRGNQFKIIGALEETRTQDDITIFIPLKKGQQIYEVGDMVSFASLTVDDVSKLELYTTKIKDVANVDVVSDKELVDSAISIIATVKTSIQLITFIAIITAIFATMNTMMTAVYERKKEIGILRCIGAKKGFIFKAFILESMIIGFIGGISGIIIGYLASIFIMPYLSSKLIIANASSQLAFLSIPTILAVIGMAIIISIIAGLYPSLKAFKLSPLEAMNHE